MAINAPSNKMGNPAKGEELVVGGEVVEGVAQFWVQIERAILTQPHDVEERLIADADQHDYDPLAVGRYGQLLGGASENLAPRWAARR